VRQAGSFTNFWIQVASLSTTFWDLSLLLQVDTCDNLLQTHQGTIETGSVLIQFSQTCHGLTAFEEMARILAAADAFGLKSHLLPKIRHPQVETDDPLAFVDKVGVVPRSLPDCLTSILS
jgi:hypothetical protein